MKYSIPFDIGYELIPKPKVEETKEIEEEKQEKIAVYG